MPHVETFLRDLAVVLVVAAFTTVICQRLRLPVVVGYILAGIITGPGTPPALVTDTTWIRTLGELGVVLLMYVIGLEFSLRRLARLLPITGPAAAVETSLMLAARLHGRATRRVGRPGQPLRRRCRRHLLDHDRREGVRREAAAAAARGPGLRDPPRRGHGRDPPARGPHRARDRGRRSSGVTAIKELLKLVGFLAILLAGGMLIVPRAIRSVVALKREETTLVAAVGIAFLFALLAQASGYSVALGAFLAGALVRESGVAHHITDLVRPLRDMFAAIFFVAVGMLVEPAGLMQAPWLVLAFTVLVLGRQADRRHPGRVPLRVRPPHGGAGGDDAGADRRVLLRHRGRRPRHQGGARGALPGGGGGVGDHRALHPAPHAARRSALGGHRQPPAQAGPDRRDALRVVGRADAAPDQDRGNLGPDPAAAPVDAARRRRAGGDRAGDFADAGPARRLADLASACRHASGSSGSS